MVGVRNFIYVNIYIERAWVFVSFGCTTCYDYLFRFVADCLVESVYILINMFSHDIVSFHMQTFKPWGKIDNFMKTHLKIENDV